MCVKTLFSLFFLVAVLGLVFALFFCISWILVAPVPFAVIALMVLTVVAAVFTLIIVCLCPLCCIVDSIVDCVF